MSGDSIDSAVNRAANRDLLVGAGVKYLGKERRRDAETLADIMMSAIETITASASVAIARPSNEGVPDAVLQDLVKQMQAHAEGIAHVAISAVSSVFVKTLRMAARAGDH
jgi:hypothetical protein